MKMTRTERRDFAFETQYVASVLTGWWLMNTHPVVGVLLMAVAIWCERERR